jgi:hypothetical protein
VSVTLDDDPRWAEWRTISEPTGAGTYSNRGLHQLAVTWPSPIVGQIDPFSSLIGVFFLAIGLGFLFTNIALFAEWFRVRSTPPSTTRAVAVGRTDIEGTVSSVSEPFEAPISETPSAYVYWELGERSNDDWETVAAGELSDRLVVRDETGAIPVEDPVETFRSNGSKTPSPSLSEASASGGAIENRTEYTVRYQFDNREPTGQAILYIGNNNETNTEISPEETAPPELRELADREELRTVADQRRRVRELVIPDGATVYAAGEAVELDAAGDVAVESDLVVTGDRSRDRFVVADRTQDDYVSLLQWRWKTKALAGILFAALGLLALLAGLDVL